LIHAFGGVGWLLLLLLLLRRRRRRKGLTFETRRQRRVAAGGGEGGKLENVRGLSACAGSRSLERERFGGEELEEHEELFQSCVIRGRKQVSNAGLALQCKSRVGAVVVRRAGRPRKGVAMR
jgi:hypothetical protein